MDEVTNPSGVTSEAAIAEQIGNFKAFGGPEEESEALEEESPEVEATEEETEPVEEPEGQPETAEVEFEGKNYHLPKELQEAILRQKDYTQKTQEVAEMRKTAESVLQQAKNLQALQEKAAPLMGQYQALTERANQYQQVDWLKLAQDDPAQAQTHWMQFQLTKDKLVEVQGEIQKSQAEQQTAAQTIMQEQAAESAKLLQKDLKGWGPELQTQLLSTGKAYGFTDQELNAITDHRSIKVLNDAMQWRKLQSTKAVKMAPGTKTLKPQASAPSSKEQGKVEFRKAIRGAKTDTQKSRIIEKDLERFF